MRRAALLLLALAAALPAHAALTPAELAEVGTRPPSDAHLPIGLSFVDQHGAPYTLEAAPIPTVLLFADYTCRHICGPGMTLTAGALHDAGEKPGRDYRMVVIGLDQDGPAKARALAAERLGALPAEAKAITLLTGSPETVARAERALGYHAVYDAVNDQFAHDASILVFAPDGRLSDLLPETATTPPQLAKAIAEAKAGKAYAPPPPKADPGIIGQITAICYGFAAAHGVYGPTIVLGLRIGGVLLCLALAGWIIRNVRRRRREEAA